MKSKKFKKLYFYIYFFLYKKHSYYKEQYKVNYLVFIINIIILYIKDLFILFIHIFKIDL
jgi:hypothetical protein